MGFFETLFPDAPRGRGHGTEEKRPKNRRRRSRSLEKLTASFAQASLERQQQSPAPSPTTPTRPSPQAVPSPTRQQSPLYRQELPATFHEPYRAPPAHRQARPAHSQSWQPSAIVWHAPPAPAQQPLPTFGSLPFPTGYPAAPAYPPSYPSYTPPHAAHLEPPRPRPARPTSVPAPPKPSLFIDQGRPNQCRGTTSNGKRCTRIVRDPSPAKPARQTAEPSMAQLNRHLSRRGRRAPRRAAIDEGSDTSDSEAGDDEEELPKFCHQHSKQAMDEPGTFAGSKGIYVKFDDWIPADLPAATKLQLRYEMARPPSKDDKPGYIYVHEMAHTSRNTASSTTLLKLGRSVKPVARLSQWKRSCPSRIPIVRGLFPVAPGQDGATLGGALAVNPIPSRFHHRWERLILIEAAGRAKLINPTANGKRGRCTDCGKRHCELFEVERGAYERWVIELVERWQRWCEQIL